MLRISEVAVMTLSGPTEVCNSPIASIKASRALLRAKAMAAPCVVARRVSDERLKSPTASRVSRTVRLRVMTKAKPLRWAGWLG